jgi:hypothetical protein
MLITQGRELEEETLCARGEQQTITEYNLLGVKQKKLSVHVSLIFFLHSSYISSSQLREVKRTKDMVDVSC